MEMACVLWVLITTGDEVCVGWELISHGDGMCVVWVLITTGDGVCVGWVLISHGDGVCVVWVLTAARLRQHGDMGACWLGVHQRWKHGCVLVGWWPATETWVCACWVVTSNGNMGLCLFVAKQHRTHEIVHIE